MDRFFLHYGIHFILPIAIVFLFFKEYKLRALIILWAAIVIDIDHVFATPIFDSNRCSINFHPLHGYWAIGVYFILLIPKKTRIFGIALLNHMLADSADCLFIFNQLK